MKYKYDKIVVKSVEQFYKKMQKFVMVIFLRI